MVICRLRIPFIGSHAVPDACDCLRRSTSSTGVIVRTTAVQTTMAWIPNTTPRPLRTIHSGWKYPTAKPPQVRHMFRMADTQVD